MSNPSITCRDFVASIAEYQGGEMPPRRRALFAAHLADCERCSTYLRSYSATVKLAKDAYPTETDDTPDDLVDSTMASLRKRKSQ
jgi:anti-sigma factor RsiW